MNFFTSIKNSISRGLDKRREDNERMDQLRKEADMERRKIFEEEFKKNALEVAKAQAMKEAAKLSGLQKLRANNRLRNLNRTSDNPIPGSFFEKLRDYTLKNKVRMQENLKLTEEMRKNAEIIKEERLAKMNQTRPVINKGFGKSTWKM